MKFSLTILGSSSALPTKNRYPAAHVLNVRERFFLIDCGEGTQMQIRKTGTAKFSRLNHIFISHLHGDHVFGLFGLISTLNLLGRTNDLHIYGHPQLQNIIDDHLRYFGNDMRYNVIIHPVDHQKNEIIYEDRCMTVETIPLKHRIPACGYLFKEKAPERNIHKQFIQQYNLSLAEIVKIKNGDDYQLPSGEIITNTELTYLPYQPRSYAYCSDTEYKEDIIPIIKGVDLLYHEATFLENLKDMAKQTGHSTAKDAATIALKAGVKKLVIGHFSSRYDDINLFLSEAKAVFPATELAIEGRVFDLPVTTPNS